MTKIFLVFFARGSCSEVARKVAHLLGKNWELEILIPLSQFPISVIAIVRVCFLNSSEVGWFVREELGAGLEFLR